MSFKAFFVSRTDGRSSGNQKNTPWAYSRVILKSQYMDKMLWFVHAYTNVNKFNLDLNVV